MTISEGTRLGRYEVRSKIGAGGMGEAQDWRASTPEKVTNFPESGLFLEDPQLSLDGRELLCSRGRVTGDLWLMDLGK